MKQFSNIGGKAINPRIVIGSLIIKHKLSISDEETVLLIRENPYMQYFLGLDEFYPYSLFTPIRYHLNCLDRNVRHINMMLDMLKKNPLGYRKMREFWIIQTLNDQQR